MSLLRWRSYWSDSTSVRQWPLEAAIQTALAGLGVVVGNIRIEPVGARTARINVDSSSGEPPIYIHRQRVNDTRIVCSLDEEYLVLKALHSSAPTLVPEPLGISRLKMEEPFLFMAGVNGRPVGSPERFHTSPDEVLQKISGALTLFHDAGRLLDADILHRSVSLARLVQSASNSRLRGTLVETSLWDRAFQCAARLTDDMHRNTLLHGDPHAYNLLETDEGLCWIDFERMCVGPRDYDLAQAWVFAYAQAEAAVKTPWDKSATETQLAFRCLAATAFLEPRKSSWTRPALQTVAEGLRIAISDLASL